MKKFTRKFLTSLFVLSAIIFSSCNLLTPDEKAGSVKFEFSSDLARAVSMRAAALKNEISFQNDEKQDFEEKFTIKVYAIGDYEDGVSEVYSMKQWKRFISGADTLTIIFSNIPEDSVVQIKAAVSKSWGTETHTIMAGVSEPITIHAGENHISLNLSYVEDYNPSEPDPKEPDESVTGTAFFPKDYAEENVSAWFSATTITDGETTTLAFYFFDDNNFVETYYTISTSSTQANGDILQGDTEIKAGIALKGTYTIESGTITTGTGTLVPDGGASRTLTFSIDGLTVEGMNISFSRRTDSHPTPTEPTTEEKTDPEEPDNPDPVEPKPEPETSTTAGITVTLAELNSEDLAEKIELKSEVTSEGVTLTAGPKSGSNITVTSYSWNVTYGDRAIEGTAANGMWAISAGKLGSGIYNVTLTVQIDGEYYSGSTTFTVTVVSEEPEPDPETSTTAGITVTLAELNSEDLAEKIELKSDVTSDRVTLTAEPKSGSNITVTSYSWNVTYGDQAIEGTAANGMWAISAGELGSGIYNVTLTVQIDGEYYSGSTTFTITKE